MSMADKYAEVCAERDRLVEQVFAYQLSLEALPLDALAKLQAALLAVRKLHVAYQTKTQGRRCRGCAQPWPCSTRQVLGE